MIRSALANVAVHWGDTKTQIEHFLGISPDAVHVHVGMLLYMGWALVLRAYLHDWRPWLATLAVECVNEWIDLNQPVGSVEANWPASQHDILNTMFLPTVLFSLSNLRRLGWLRGR